MNKYDIDSWIPYLIIFKISCNKNMIVWLDRCYRWDFFILFFKFDVFRKHQEPFVNILHVIFEKIMTL